MKINKGYCEPCWKRGQKQKDCDFCYPKEIILKTKTLELLDKHKLYSNQTYDSIIWNLIKDKFV